MRVIQSGNYKTWQPPDTLECASCGCIVDQVTLADLFTVKVNEGPQWDSYDVTKAAWQCPECPRQNTLSGVPAAALLRISKQRSNKIGRELAEHY